MSTKMLSPEEELEKQYRDYKAQFEQWKEKNKNSVGTEAYIAYVEQFEAWERDVDRRREMIRAKAEAEAQEAQAKAQAQAAAEAKRKKELEAEEEKKKQQEAEAAAQAAAYAHHQQSYLAHHQAAIQKEQLLRQQQEAAAAVPTVDGTVADETLDRSRMADLMQQMAQMAQMVMGQTTESFEGDALYPQQIAQPAPQPAQQIVGPPPQLWGNDRIVFDTNDSMHTRWGIRAAPPYHKPVYKPSAGSYQPCWLFLEQMKEEKLMLAPQVNVPPPPIIPSFAPPGH